MTTADRRPRRRLSADARRRQLETAAIEVVARRGFAAATADEIAHAAGVSKGLLWRYFASLDELIIQAGRRALADLEAAVAADIDLDADAGDLLRSAIGRAARLPATHGTQLRALRQIAVNLRGPDGEAALRDSEYASLHERQATLIRHGQQRGQIRTDLDADLLAVIYQGMVDTMLDHLETHPGLDHRRVADHLAEVLLAGISPPRNLRG